MHIVLVALRALLENILEELSDADVLLGGDLKVRKAVLFCKFFTFSSSHDSFLIEVNLRPDNDFGGEIVFR